MLGYNSGFGLWVKVHGSCDVMHDVKDILGYGLWTLGHGLWILPIIDVMHDVMQWFMGFRSSSMGHGLWTWVLGHG